MPLGPVSHRPVQVQTAAGAVWFNISLQYIQCLCFSPVQYLQFQTAAVPVKVCLEFRQ